MNAIKIGSQEWASEDLKVTKFRNGEDIPLVTDNTEWVELETAAYCISPDGSHLYNWYAVNDPRGLAPDGFHVPSDNEWTELVEHLGGEEVAGEQMKASSWNGTNSSGFNALPSGFRKYWGGLLKEVGYGGYWWTSSADGTNLAWYLALFSDYGGVYRNNGKFQNGFSVRCLKTLNPKEK